jgi:hypothetical protein
MTVYSFYVSGVASAPDYRKTVYFLFEHVRRTRRDAIFQRLPPFGHFTRHFSKSHFSQQDVARSTVGNKFCKFVFRIGTFHLHHLPNFDLEVKRYLRYVRVDAFSQTILETEASQTQKIEPILDRFSRIKRDLQPKEAIGKKGRLVYCTVRGKTDSSPCDSYVGLLYNSIVFELAVTLPISLCYKTIIEFCVVEPLYRACIIAFHRLTYEVCS